MTDPAERERIRRIRFLAMLPSDDQFEQVMVTLPAAERWRCRWLREHADTPYRPGAADVALSGGERGQLGRLAPGADPRLTTYDDARAALGGELAADASAELFAAGQDGAGHAARQPWQDPDDR